MTKNEGLTKAERICAKTESELVFSKGKRLRGNPVTGLFLLHTLPTDHHCKVLFSVPKKKLRSSVDRNRIKRLMRDVYRKNKSKLFDILNTNEKKLLLVFMYTQDKVLSRAEIEKSMLKILEKAIEYVKITKIDE